MTEDDYKYRQGRDKYRVEQTERLLDIVCLYALL